MTTSNYTTTELIAEIFETIEAIMQEIPSWCGMHHITEPEDDGICRWVTDNGTDTFKVSDLPAILKDLKAGLESVSDADDYYIRKAICRKAVSAYTFQIENY